MNENRLNGLAHLYILRGMVASETESSWREQFRAQRLLYQHKFKIHWSATINACYGDYRALWSKLQPLYAEASPCINF